MKLVEGYREVAKGKASFGPMTIAGAVLGSKAASRSLERAIFNAGERKIYRKIQVWSCPTCVKQVKAELRMPINWLTVGVFIISRNLNSIRKMWENPPTMANISILIHGWQDV
jgi:hypothetical protein